MKSTVLVGIALVAGFCAQPASASDWGCEVLLCAASSNPSWRGVQACHPPMNRLIAAMKRPGFSWPSCPQAGTGKPGYEEFSQCPAGWTPTSGGDEEPGFGSRQSRCMRVIHQCPGSERGRMARRFDDDRRCNRPEYMARPRRDTPYYFDIKDTVEGTERRYYFELR